MTDTFEQAKQLFLRGVQAYESKLYAEAERHFEASLALLPGRASTLSNLGATRLKLGRPGEALEPLEQALAAEPADGGAWCHKADALNELHRHEEALACWQRALEIDANSLSALSRGSLTLNALDRHDEALKLLERLLALQPEHAESWVRHGQTLQQLGRHDEALGSYERALSIDDSLAQAWSNRGGILKDLKRIDEAVRCYEQALAHGGDAEVNGYFLASLKGSTPPASAPRHYVSHLFDDYAEGFDEHLQKVLRYEAPQVLVRNLEGLGDKARWDRALDLGCGTGLCGPLLKPLVGSLDGVDLSRNMLEKAKPLGVYERLVHAEIVEHLQETGSRYDLVVSADVFIYVGDLEPVFQGVQRVLNQGGVFCFSAELAPDDVDFTLLETQRYAHSKRYVRELAERYGFTLGKLVEHPIREDQRKPIAGFFAYLVKG